MKTGKVLLLIAVLAAFSITARADAVTEWNAIAVQATLNAGASRPGPSGFIDVAMVQAAIYDAVQAIDRRFEPYFVEVPGASGSPAAAAAKAAHDVLVNRFPAQAAALDTAYQQYLANNGLSDSDPGVAVGATVAARLIASRSCDGSFPAAFPPFIGGTNPGEWRPTPPGNLPMAAPWLASMTPFTLSRPSQFRGDGPPAMTSRQYARDYNEVKLMGSLTNSSRTAEQTDQAQFWAGNFLVIWNQALRDLAVTHIDNIGDSARLFALVELSMADAVITSWNTKKLFNFWRPITAIRLGDTDGNPRTTADPNWTSLIVNPNYPDFTSGANSVTGAAARALALYFDTDRMTFTMTTTNVVPTNQDTRTFHQFSQVADEVVDARVWLGIHFRFADTAARRDGTDVANWVFRNFLRPLGHNHGGNDEGDDNQISEPQINQKSGMSNVPASRERLSIKSLRIVDQE